MSQIWLFGPTFADIHGRFSAATQRQTGEKASLRSSLFAENQRRDAVGRFLILLRQHVTVNVQSKGHR
jgi:hypothetical protein